MTALGHLPNTCPFHPLKWVTTEQGRSLCAECADRIWQELHWLADVYDCLFAALTHRLNVEKAEQVKVHGGKDPMVRGMDLNDEAANLRHRIRGISYAGLAWLYERNPALGGVVPSGETAQVLRYIARHLHWVASDQDWDRMGNWGSRVVAARQDAEVLVTPASGHPIRIHGHTCQKEIQAEDGVYQICGSGLHTYREDTTLMWCDQNPAHTVSRETAIKQAVMARSQAGPARALLEAIAKGSK
jgi:hypothetical protein